MSTKGTRDNPPRIVGLFRPEEIQQANANIWPSVGSFKWWTRMNDAELKRRGAVHRIAGRNFYHGVRTIDIATGTVAEAVVLSGRVGEGHD